MKKIKTNGQKYLRIYLLIYSSIFPFFFTSPQMKSMSITGRGIEAFVNTMVIYSTVELKAKSLSCNTVTMANCGFLPAEMCDDNHCLFA